MHPLTAKCILSQQNASSHSKMYPPIYLLPQIPVSPPKKNRADLAPHASSTPTSLTAEESFPMCSLDTANESTVIKIGTHPSDTYYPLSIMIVGGCCCCFESGVSHMLIVATDAYIMPSITATATIR